MGRWIGRWIGCCQSRSGASGPITGVELAWDIGGRESGIHVWRRISRSIPSSIANHSLKTAHQSPERRPALDVSGLEWGSRFQPGNAGNHGARPERVTIMRKFGGVLPCIALFVVCGCEPHRQQYRHYPTIPGVEGGQAEWAYRDSVNRVDGENYRNGYAIPLRCRKCGNPVREPLELCELCK